MSIAMDAVLEKAGKRAALAEEIKSAISRLYDAIEDLDTNWRTTLINGETVASNALDAHQMLNVDALPTWGKIRELLTTWRAVDEDYRQAWAQLPENERESLREDLDPDFVAQSDYYQPSKKRPRKR